MELNGLNFVNTVLDHFRAKTIYFTFLSDGDLSEIFEHQRDNSFGGRGSDDWPTVADCFAEIGQRATMI